MEQTKETKSEYSFHSSNEKQLETWGERFDSLCASFPMDVRTYYSLIGKEDWYKVQSFIEKEISSAVQKERERIEVEIRRKIENVKALKLEASESEEIIIRPVIAAFQSILSALNERDLSASPTKE